MATKKYQGMTYDEMNALVNKKYSDLTESERTMMGLLTKQDYDDYARETNWATSTPTYTGWNGGSVTGSDSWQAAQDANRYGYDIWLDPRNNHQLHGDIQNLFRDVDQRANEMAIAGQGDYETNRAELLSQTGWTDYQTLFSNLQNTGSLGLTNLNGEDMTELAMQNKLSQLPGAPYEYEPGELEAMQQAYAQQQAQQNYINSHLSPLMQGQSGGTAAGQSGAWSYNADEDPIYQSYLSKYQRAGEKSMADTLGQISARTGGMASSYAGQAAQQTYNDYLQGATDMIPELAQDDYSRWLTDQQMAIEADERAYQRQQNELDRQLAAEQTAYERQIYAQELQAEQQRQNANLVLSLMENYGYIPTDEELDMLGINRTAADSITNAYQNELALAWAKTEKSGSGGAEATDYLSMLQQANVRDQGTAAFVLTQAGLDVDDAETLAAYYMDILEQQGGPEGVEPVADESMLPSELYNEAVLRLNDYLYSGTEGQVMAAMNFVERIWEQLSSSEKQNIIAMFAAAGYNLQG